MEKEKAREQKQAALMALPRRTSGRVARLQEAAAVRAREELEREEQLRMAELERRRIQAERRKAREAQEAKEAEERERLEKIRRVEEQAERREQAKLERERRRQERLEAQARRREGTWAGHSSVVFQFSLCFSSRCGAFFSCWRLNYLLLERRLVKTEEQERLEAQNAERARRGRRRHGAEHKIPPLTREEIDANGQRRIFRRVKLSATEFQRACAVWRRMCVHCCCAECFPCLVGYQILH